MISIRRRLLLSFAGLALLPTSVLAGAALYGAWRFAEQQAREELTRMLDSLGESISLELNAESVFLDHVAIKWSARGPGAEADAARWVVRDSEVRSRLRLEPLLASRILFLPRDGGSLRVLERRRGGLDPPGERVLAAETLGADLARLADAPEETYRWRWTDARPTGAVVSVARRLPGRDPAGDGVLIEEIPALALVEQLLERPAFRSLRGTYAAAPLAGGVWVFLYHADPTRIGLPAAGIVRSESGAWKIYRDGPWLRAGGTHADTGWRLGGAVSLAPAAETLNSVLVALLVLLALLALLVSAGIFLVTRGIGRAVEEIASAASAIAQGDFDRTVRVRRSDEFALIADRVNSMARELRLTAESRAIARISAGLVHDITGVVQQLKLLLHNLRRNIDDAEFRAECFELMQALIDDVEALGLRLKHGGGKAPAAPFDLDDLIGQLLGGARLSSHPGIRVRHERGAARPLVTVRDTLKGVLENLLTNAVDAMGDRGELRVRSGPVDRPRGKETGGPTHFVEVEDDGGGMSREFVEQELFRPFATTKPGGIGLGMYTVREALHKLGGTIDVHSREGRGTRVRIEIGRAPGDGG